MLPINLKFQAFIPNSLGKPLKSYFEHHPYARRLENREEFFMKLAQKDRHGYTWLPEPIGNNFFATDDTDFHLHHREHTMRLGFEICIEPEKIGQYWNGGKNRVFVHTGHNGADPLNQHSGLSHRVTARIYRTSEDTCIGKVSERIHRSEEIKLDSNIDSSMEWAAPNYGNAKTTITVGASAGYPFLEPFAPNIEFEMTIEFFVDFSGKKIDVEVSGRHNDFPAYELIIDHGLEYSYNPSDYGETGPGIYNLNKWKKFHALKWILLEDWQIRDLKHKLFSTY